MICILNDCSTDIVYLIEFTMMILRINYRVLIVYSALAFWMLIDTTKVTVK